MNEYIDPRSRLSRMGGGADDAGRINAARQAGEVGSEDHPVLTVTGLRAYYEMKYFGIVREVRAVDDISLVVKRNEIYGLAGESSCGKTTLIKTIAGAIRPPLNVVGGSVRFDFRERCDQHLRGRARSEVDDIRWEHLSYIMQGSMNVLNPVRRVREAFVDFAFRHIGKPMGEFLAIVENHLKRLHLEPRRAECLSARVVRRHAPARHHRVGHRLPSGVHHRRRAHHGTRRRRAEATCSR